MKHVETVTIGDATLTLETGQIAPQAHGSVVVREGRSFLLAAVVSDPEPRAGADFFPLTVDYRERMSAAGRIPGSYGRREGRPTNQDVLRARLVDRTLRPLFPKGFRCETQVSLTVFSADEQSDLESLALVAAGAAVHLSDVPFAGPVAGLRVARVDGAFVAVPRPDALARADLDFVVCASRDGVVMVEGDARRLPDEVIVDALDAATAALGPVMDACDRLREAAGRPKRRFEPPRPDRALASAVSLSAGRALDAALDTAEKTARREAIAAARRAVVGELTRGGAYEEAAVVEAFEGLLHHVMRRRILDGQRIGGRALDEVRDIACEVGLLPGAHGSALFQRGETQALVTATLGTDGDALAEETLSGRQFSEFFLHYNFPSYSVGEAKPSRGPGRREIGHGMLAQRALAPVVPSKAEFPYTIRVVSDITASNGSSSMASVCGGCLALMDAGVPIEAPVAGIAMGLIKEGDRVAVLSDILGDEDHLGDMDFKVAGTADGVTAVQLDNKLGSLPREVLVQALTQAREGRRFILREMAGVLDEARKHVAADAPQFATTRVDPHKVGRVIGAGGSTIKGIQAQTGTRINIDDDGTVRISGKERDNVQAAIRRVEEVAMDLVRDGVYVAEVVTIKDFGAFVRIGAHEGLVHVSELASERVGHPSQVVSVGDEVLIRVMGVDDKGRLQLSRRAAEGVPRSEAVNG